MIEAKIREYEAKLALSVVIEPTELDGDVVKFGATVKVEDPDSGEQMTYTIVGEHEADIKNKRISVTAPVARALIGKAVGDEVKVQTPKGSRMLEIVSVEWLPVAWMDPNVIT